MQEKAQAVLWYAEFKSIITVQRQFRRVFQKNAPDPKTIKEWTATFLATGSVQKRHGGGRRVSEERVEDVRTAFTRSPRKSTRRASRELQMPRTTLQRVLHKRLRLYAYKVQILHEIKPQDRPQRQNFAADILERINQNNDFLSQTSQHFMCLGKLTGTTLEYGVQKTHMSSRNIYETALK